MSIVRKIANQIENRFYAHGKMKKKNNKRQNLIIISKVFDFYLKNLAFYSLFTHYYNHGNKHTFYFDMAKLCGTKK
jgi:hypothetical protein